MVRIGIVGYGYWGPNLARNFNELDGAELVMVSDSDPARLAVAAKRYLGRPHGRGLSSADSRSRR